MGSQGVVHIVDAQADDERKPERNPDQKNIRGNLNQSFLPTWQT